MRPQPAVNRNPKIKTEEEKERDGTRATPKISPMRGKKRGRLNIFIQKEEEGSSSIFPPQKGRRGY